MDLYYFNKFLSIFVKVTSVLIFTAIILLIIPTVGIMATWNTLPGEKLYPVKRYIETTALRLFTGNFAVTADIQSQILDQRFSENQVLLSQASTEGFVGLTQQIQAAKIEIVTATNNSTTKTKSSNQNIDTVVVQKKAEKLVVQLKEYEQKLEIAKTQISEGQPVKVIETINTVKIIPTVEVIQPDVTATPTTQLVVIQPTKVPEVVRVQVVTTPNIQNPNPVAHTTVEKIDKVEKAQEEIKIAIVELEKVVEKEKEKKKEENKKQNEIKKQQDNNNKENNNNDNNNNNSDYNKRN